MKEAAIGGFVMSKKYLVYSGQNLSLQAEGDRDGIVDGIHRTRVDGAHFFFKPAFIDGSHLLEQHDAVL